MKITEIKVAVAVKTENQKIEGGGGGGGWRVKKGNSHIHKSILIAIKRTNSCRNIKIIILPIS